MEPGSIIAVSSTVSPDTVKALDAIARKKGIDVLDAPICRGRWAADEGTLLALFGGKPEVVERARPVYGTFASDIVHLGDVGHGQVAKTMNNLLLWVNAVGLIEAGKLALSTGIDLPKLRGADDVVGQVGGAQRLGHDHLHLGAQGHADRSQMTDKPACRCRSPARSRNWSRKHVASRRSNSADWTGKGPVKYG